MPYIPSTSLVLVIILCKAASKNTLCLRKISLEILGPLYSSARKKTKTVNERARKES